VRPGHRRPVSSPRPQRHGGGDAALRAWSRRGGLLGSFGRSWTRRSQPGRGVLHGDGSLAERLRAAARGASRRWRRSSRRTGTARRSGRRDGTSDRRLRRQSRCVSEPAGPAACVRVAAAVPAARLVLVSHPDARRAARRCAGRLAGGGEIIHRVVRRVRGGSIERTSGGAALRVDRIPDEVLNYMAAGKADRGGGWQRQGARRRDGPRRAGSRRGCFGRAIADLLADGAERRRLGGRACAGEMIPERVALSVTAIERVYDEVRRV